MTVKELYEWAVKNGVENYNIEISNLMHRATFLETEKLYSDFIDIDKTKSRVIL